MILYRTPIRVVLCILSGLQLLFPQGFIDELPDGELQAETVVDSVYSHTILTPDFLNRYIAIPFPSGPPGGLNLVGWSSYDPTTDTIEVPEVLLPDTSQLELTISIEETRDVLRRAGKLFAIEVTGLEQWSEFDSLGKAIIFHEELNGTAIKVPFTTRLDWYIEHRLEDDLHTQTRERLTRTLERQTTAEDLYYESIELFGGQVAGQSVSLRIMGNLAINGGILYKDQDIPGANWRANRNWDFDIDQRQRFDIEGTIGDRISVLVRQDSENDFDWENDMEISYTGHEDEILKRVEAGNISMSLPGTQFATGGGGQSSGLFGLKAESQLGPVNLTTIASIERSQKSTKRSALEREFSISDANYMANRYFFLDMQFREMYYPLDEAGAHTYDPARRVARLEVYKAVWQQEPGTYSATAYIDPEDESVEPNYKRAGNYRRLEIDTDYTFEPQLGWIRLNVPAYQNEIIAVAYVLGDTATFADTVGTINLAAADTTSGMLRLKIIKDQGQTAGHPCWPLEFKNVYSLGGVNIDPEGLEVKIINTKGDTENDDRWRDDVSYLTIFGLDQEDENREPNADERIDAYKQSIVKTSLGELHFPALLPFAYSDSIPGLATNNPAIKEEYGFELEDINQNFLEDDEDLNGNGEWDVPAIYYDPVNSQRWQDHRRFEIQVQQTGRGFSDYNLGFNLVEGSETVYVNGDPLIRGEDYEIDYFMGTLRILNLADYGANPEIEISYEENVFISFDKKVMLGTRAEMSLGEGSFIGLTGLYYNQSIVDERIEVGSEPIRNMLWDVNGRFEREIPLLTRLMDRLPLVQTEAASRVRFEGEFAQVLPDPNPLGEAYIDDFEAAKRATTPTLRYNGWSFASTPVGKQRADRLRLAWWNPYTDVSVKSIWPERETSIRAQNQTTTILILDALSDGGYGAVTEDSWGGITYPLMASEYDQTLSKFFEIWVRGTEGRLHIDVGSISEDLNDNLFIDTEDRPEIGWNEGDKRLDPEEDVGLDGCPDEYEDGMGGRMLTDGDGNDDYWDFNKDGEVDEEEQLRADDDGDGLIDEDSIEVAIAFYAGEYDGIYDGPRVPWADAEDPNGDNFHQTKAWDPVRDRNDHVNGTEGNSEYQEGRYPDTEDLDGMGGTYPETLNNYFSYYIQLDPNHSEFDSTLVAGSTERNGIPTGWRLFRVPLTDFWQEGAMTAKWDNVRRMRLWVDGLDSTLYLNMAGINARIQIANIEFVGNTWEELGLAQVGSDTYVRTDSVASLAVAVANTEDNADYVSPPGVTGEVDRLYNIRLREQSLLLDFSRQGIPPQHKGAVKKSISTQTGTFLIYGSMDMYIYAEGVDDLIGENSTYAQFWLRLGQGKEEYYEIRKPVYSGGPDEEHRGWDSRNHLSIDLDKLAGHKIQADPDTTIIIDTDTIPGYFMDDMEVYIRGNPSVDRIDQYIAGIINRHDSDTLKGRIMLDELRLSDVKREGGVAMRFSGAVNFADLLSTSLSYAVSDADFHNVQGQISRNSATSENIRMNMTFNPHLFLPQAWGVRSPLTFNYNHAVSTPKYLPGEDIPTETVTRDSILQTVLTQSEQVSFKASFDKSTRSKNWLVRQTFDRFGGNISYTRKTDSNVNIMSNVSQNINTQLTYPISFSEENYIQPFQALASIPWLGERIKDTRFYYTPSNINFGAELTESFSDRITRADPDTTSSTYSFNLARSVSSQYRITDRLSTSYAWNGSNILGEDEFRGRELRVFQSLDPGLSRQFTETFTTNYNPELITWFNPTFRYQANYRWVKKAPIDDPLRGGDITANGVFTGNVNVQLTDIIEAFYTPENGRSPTQAGQNTTTEKEQDAPAEDSLETASLRLEDILEILHTGAGKITPVAINYSFNRRTREDYVRGQPDYAYRMALITESGLVFDSEHTDISLYNITESRSISWRTGLRISQSLNFTFSQSHEISETHTHALDTRNTSRNWLYLEKHPKIGIPFVSYSVNWSNLEQLPLLNKLEWRVTLAHSYVGTFKRNVRKGNFPNDTYERRFQPLAGLTINFSNNVNANIRANHTLQLEQLENGFTKRISKQVTASMTYRRTGFVLPLPFLADVSLRNTVNFTLGFDYNKTDQYRASSAKLEFHDPWDWSNSVAVTAGMSYTFTANVTGGLDIAYRENNWKTRGKTINRDFRFNVNIAFRGS